MKLLGSTKNKITKDENEGELQKLLKQYQTAVILSTMIINITWFIDQSSKLLEIDDKINIILVVN